MFTTALCAYCQLVPCVIVPPCPACIVRVWVTPCTAFMVMLNATAAEVPSLFVAVTEKLNVPAVVGVPDITPLLLRVSPAGSEPLETVQLVGLFVAVRVTL